jgi:NAD(P)-dependent dehydrogenase (short-subunit alcohol dehydrogenase family)
MSRLEGKVAVVTGAGKGIGRGIARRFAREGAKVVVAELDPDAGKRVADDLGQLGGEGLFVQTDVSQKADIEGAVAAAQESFGGLDILVNNAIALTPDVPLELKTDEMLEQTLEVGLWSVWWGMQSAFPALKARGGGRIINFYSIDADIGNWVHGDYNIAKGGVQALTRTAGFQWARLNILVNAIAPIAASAAFEQMVAANPGFAEMANQMNPSGRMGDPEDDIAPVVAFLASDEARYITGATIPVDGGLHVPRLNTRPPDLSVFDSPDSPGQ